MEETYNVFVQEYSPENNQEIMEGTNKFPFRVVGIFVDWTENRLTVKSPKDDTFCCAPVLLQIFKSKPISLYFDSQYIQNVTPFLIDRRFDGEYIFNTYQV